MSDHDTRPSGQPAAPSPSEAPTLTDGEANRQLGEGMPPQPTERHVSSDLDASQDAAMSSAHSERAEREPNVGDAHAPASSDDVVEGGDKNLYDRLADKDVTPVSDHEDI